MCCGFESMPTACAEGLYPGDGNWQFQKSHEDIELETDQDSGLKPEDFDTFVAEGVNRVKVWHWTEW